MDTHVETLKKLRDTIMVFLIKLGVAFPAKCLHRNHCLNRGVCARAVAHLAVLVAAAAAAATTWACVAHGYRHTWVREHVQTLGRVLAIYTIQIFVTYVGLHSYKDQSHLILKFMKI